MNTTTPRSSRDASVSEAPRTDRLDAIRLTDLHKSFDDVTTVDDIDLAINLGEVVALLGPNGTGKTTAVNMILGLSRPTSGDARVFGMSPRQAVDRGLVAAIIQTAGLPPDITVRETVQLTTGPFPHRVDVEDAVCRADVTDFASCIVKKCPGGQQQHLHFAMAFVSNPALLTFDGPTADMNVEEHRSFQEAAHADAKRGHIIVFATHYLEETDAFANRVALMRHGHIIADGITAEIRVSVSGRSLRVALTRTPGRLHDALTDPQIHGQVHDVEILDSSLILSLTDTDAVATLLLSEHPARDLEVTSRGLEDAFMTLISDGAPILSAGAST